MNLRDLAAASPEPLRLDAADLPRGLLEIAEHIGLPATLALVETWGGVRLYLPLARNLTERHPLVERLGRVAAEGLCQHLGGAELPIPRALNALRAARDRAIHAEHADGVSARDLARRYQLSERRVWEVLATPPGALGQAASARGEEQLSLF